jgi:DNA-binding NtrC family response regulator
MVAMHSQTITRPRGRPRLLCVDDEPQVLEGLKLLLGRRYDIQVAADGAEALQALEIEPVPVVICDLRMPGIGGAEFLERVSERWPKIVPIILSGANSFEDSATRLREELAFRFLSKPVDPQVLRETVAAALAHHEILARDCRAPLS